jgi:hypothetical protein
LGLFARKYGIKLLLESKCRKVGGVGNVGAEVFGVCFAVF